MAAMFPSSGIIQRYFPPMKISEKTKKEKAFLAFSSSP